MAAFTSLIKYVDVTVTIFFIIVFARVIKYLYNEIKSANEKTIKCIMDYAKKLEIRDKENNETSERLRQSLEMLTTAIINNSGLDRRSAQRGEEDA